MTGIKHFNFPAFDRAEIQLSLDGWTPINPANIDRAIGLDCLEMSGDPSELGWDNRQAGIVICRDIMAISECQAIYMLKGWETSKGANIELGFANLIGIQVIHE